MLGDFRRDDFLTVFVIDCDSVCGSVWILVLSYHHRNFQLLQPLFGKCNANVATWNFSALREGTYRTGPNKTYLVCFIIQAIFSVVQWEAAIIRSPSFSLPSSSMTTKNSPRPNASKASSIESNLNSSVWPFMFVEELPSFAGFELDDDRGRDVTNLCLKSAMGAIPESSVSFK